MILSKYDIEFATDHDAQYTQSIVCPMKKGPCACLRLLAFYSPFRCFVTCLGTEPLPCASH